MNQNRHRERIGFIIAVVLYGTVGMFLRFSGLPSEAVALYRGVLGALFILLYRSLRGEKPDTAKLEGLLRNASIFGVDLVEAGLADKVCAYFTELTAGPGAVRATLHKYVNA